LDFEFIHVRKAGGEIAVRGQPAVRLGTPVKFGGALGGIFANWRWNAQSRELTAEVDQFGLFNLFYSVTSDGIVLSPSPLKLIAEGANPEIDEAALATFRVLGWYLDEDTPFKHIKVLPPNGRLSWCNGRVEITGGMQLAKERQITLSAAIDGYSSLFAHAVRSCADTMTRPRLVVPLSGGRDSRHLVLEARKQDIKIDHCATLDHTHGRGVDPEAKCASILTKRIGVRHVIVHADWASVPDQVTTLGLTHLCSDENTRAIPLAEYLKPLDCSIFDGLGGDILSRSRYFSDRTLSNAVKSGRSADAAKHWLDKPADRDTAPEIKELAKGRIVASLDRFRDTADPNTQFLSWNRSRREIGLQCSSILNHAAEVFCPYYSPELVHLCSSLPAEITSDGKFHDHVIQRDFSEVADVPHNEAVKTVWPKATLVGKAREIARASAAMWPIGVGAVVSEPVRQAKSIVDRQYRANMPYRIYRDALEAVSTKSGANRFLGRMATI
jgi:asparagine synthase (glutamine-hydrolysing)